MSPGNVAGIAAQRRVKCNGSGAEDEQRHHDTIGFPEMLMEMILVWYAPNPMTLHEGLFNICTSNRLLDISLRLIPSLAEAVARIHEAGICDMCGAHGKFPAIRIRSWWNLPRLAF